MLALRTVSTGGLSSAPVHPREVFALAIRAAAAAVVVAHNHPSGDPQPSADDRSVTERLRQAGELVGIVTRTNILAALYRAALTYW